MGSRRRVPVAVAAVVLVAAGVLASCANPPRLAAPVDGPGVAGPCGVVRHDVPNPAEPRHAVKVFEPTGVGVPWTGGSCGDDRRPLVVLLHGYLATAPEIYQGLIDHLVGTGFVVVFPSYDAQFDPERQYRAVDQGLDAGVVSSGRVDLDRVGVVGHSFGGGMTPWMVQEVAARGWGGAATWAVLFAPWFALGVGSGPIDLPAHTRLAVVAYQDDVFVDARIGIEIFRAVDLPVDQRDHLTVLTDTSHLPALSADHLGPVSFEFLPFLGGLATDQYDRWASYRTVDAVGGCALDGRWCGTDLADMGRWPDGAEVRRGRLSDAPVDVGPPALQECEFLLNPRPCPRFA